MSEELIVRNCSPTLAGIKSANMFSAHFSSNKQLTEELRALNRRLTPKGLRFIPINIQKTFALIYVYRPAVLERELSAQAVKRLLKEHGYENCGVSDCLATLRRKLRQNGDFPHEIGLFLGYPPGDVKGFIENGAKREKCTGVWKVYTDEKYARKTFAEYKSCTDAFLEKIRLGSSIESLAAST